TNESDGSFLMRLARQYGAIASVKNGNLLFIRQGQGKSASGKPLPVITITRKDGDTCGKKLAQVIAKLLPLQLLRGVGLEQRQHVHLARKSLVEAVNADQIPDLYGSHVPCLQATMHGLPVATRPKIKMVQLQFTPFASDDTYHWQTTM
ncbi:hypothetical protein, partial [Escherichia coli]